MLSFGGFDPTSTASYAEQDPRNYGIGIFSLRNLTWGTSFDPAAEEYTRAQIVDDYYAKKYVLE